MEDGEFQMQHITCDNSESFHYPHFADEKTRGSDLENDLRDGKWPLCGDVRP